MPELPEVETIIRGLNKLVRGLTIRDIFLESFKIIKYPKADDFIKNLKGKKIISIFRKGKNILIELNDNNILLIHLKLTGHLLYGQWQLKNKQWQSLKKGHLNDPQNRFIRLILKLSNGQMLALSDLRKFAKIMLIKKEEIEKLPELKKLGIDPLTPQFNLVYFKNLVNHLKQRRPRLTIKNLLLDQSIISGIGNIYSDEILFVSKIHPLKQINRLTNEDIKRIYKAIISILKEAIKRRGSSVGYGDYRDLSGAKGNYASELRVYQREKKICSYCGQPIKKIKIGSRSSYFCPHCQKL